MSQDVNRATLPASLTSFVGREREVSEIAGLIRDRHVRLLTLLGPGGVGKTRLAIQAAKRLADAFLDGVWFVDLAPLTDPALVLPTIARSLGLQETGEEPIDRRLAHLPARPEGAAAVGQLRADRDGRARGEHGACRLLELVILATSRVPLSVAGEHEYSLHPLIVHAALDDALRFQTLFNSSPSARGHAIRTSP